MADLLAILNNLRPEDEAEYRATLADTPKGLAASGLLSTRPFCWTAGRVAFIAAHRTTPHCFGISMAATPEWPSVALSVTKWVRREMIPILRSVGALRAEARMVDGHPSAGKWMESLGAVHEAEMPLAGINGETLHLYAWRACDPIWKGN